MLFTGNIYESYLFIGRMLKMGAIARLFLAPLISTPIVEYLRRDFRDFKSVSAAKI